MSQGGEVWWGGCMYTGQPSLLTRCHEGVNVVEKYAVHTQ